MNTNEIDNDYLKEEVRCGFRVGIMMKRCWAAQIKVLLEIDKICHKHGIRYFAADGTLLGAVRHEGYIPWDDDLDIGMLRPDYMRFLAIADRELPEPYRLAAYNTDANHEQPLSSVINRNDVGENENLNEQFYGCPFIVGVDIIPFDYLPINNDELGIQISLFQLAASTISYYDDFVCDGSIGKRVELFENASGIEINRHMPIRQQLGLATDMIASMYSEEESECVAHLYEYARMDFDKVVKYNTDWFSEIVYLPFEYIEIPAVVGYNSFLEALYGDYDKPVRYTAMHEYPFYRKQIPLMSDKVKDKYKRELIFNE